MTSQRTPEIKPRILTAFALSLAALTVLIALSATAAAQNPVPFLDQLLVPDATAPGGPGFTLTVNGAGFVAASVVNWNGSPRSTTFVSSSRLTAAIHASDIATASTATVTVVSPRPGGGVSNTQFFSINVSASSTSFAGAVTYSLGGSGAVGSDSIAIADVNGDGIPDLLVAICSIASYCGYSNGAVGVLLGNGDGTFQPLVTYDTGGVGTNSVAVADLDGDGKRDLVVANANASTVGVLLGNGDGTFRPVTIYSSGGSGPQSVVVADVNRDGKPDILVMVTNEDFEELVGVLLGNGDGTFQPAVTYDSGGSSFGNNPSSLAAADLSGDGKLDLAVTSGCGNCSGSVGVLLGNGDGTFQTAVTYGSGGQTATSVAIADVDGDGKPDLLVANSDCIFPFVNPCGQSTIGVLLGNGDGTFQSVVSYSSGDGGDSVVAADVNGDGKPDLVVANACVLNASGYCSGSAGSGASVLLGNGDGTFQPVLTYGSGGYGESNSASAAIAVADLNGDGKPDLTVTPSCSAGCGYGYAAVGVLLNNTAAGPTTTRLASSLNPSTYGQTVTLTASVRSTMGTPTGTVVFSGGSPATTLGSASLVSGSASISVSSLKGGSDSITATYQGSLTFGSSTSAPLNQVVKPATTATALTSSLNPSLVGQAVTFTATVTSAGGTPDSNGETEDVTFYNGLSALGSAFPTGGIASLTKSSLSAGIHTISAAYLGDANFAASTSPALQQAVDTSTQSATTTALASSLNPSTYGQAVTWTATVTTSGSTTPTGKVNFKWSNYSVGSATLNSSGIATLTRSNLSAAPYPLFAEYTGDANNGPSASPILNQVITQTTSTATLTSSPNPSIQGQAVTFTAEVTSPTTTPTGPVTFTAGKTTLGTVELSKGKATFTTSTLAVGSTTVTVTYPWNSDISASSASVLQTVTATTTTGTAATLTWLANPPQNETFTATITSSKGIPTGSVTFTVGNTVLGTSQLSNGIATLTTSTLSVGSNTVTATYSGDANNSPISAWATQTFVMPYNATLYLQQLGGSASATTEFGTGTSSSNFVEYYSGLPSDPDPTGQLLVGSFTAGTIVNFGMFTQFGSQSGWAFSTGTDQASLVSFADLNNTLGLNHSITQQTSPTTWVLNLDDAVSYLYDDDNNDVIMEIILVPN